MNDNKLFNEFPPVTTEQWEAVIEKDLKGADYNKKLIWKTNEGFDVKPYYRANDIENLEYLQNNPSQEPFVRGYNAKDNSWDVRQDFDSEDLSYQNAMMLQALERGANSIGINATKVEKKEDFAILFKDVKLDIIKVNFLKSKNFLSLLKMYCEFLQQNNINTAEVEGSINFDIFAYALKHGGYYSSLQNDMQELEEIITFAKENLPKFKVININAIVFKDAGSNITQELGFALSLANEYVAMLTDKGFALKDITSRLMFSFATGSDYFLEIAKLRSARLLWSNIIEQYESATPQDAKSYIHTENTLYNKTIFDAHVNLLRTTTETMSSVIAGADSISVKPFDVALKESDEFSLRLALNQQILLKEESYLDKIVDPSSGSYYIETLTNNISEKAWEIFQQIEAMGGYAKAIENNSIQDKIEEMSNLVAKDIAKRKKVLVGTNQYPNLMEKEIDYKRKECCSKAEKNSFKPLCFNREALPFEKLRLEVISAKKVPTVFLLLYGNLSMRTARAGFASNFFGVAGYEIANNKGFDTIDEAAEAIIKANNDILVLCSSDDEYPELVRAILPKIKGKIQHIIVAGNPADEIKQEFDQAGVTDYINVRTNALESLTKYNKELIN
ncbi:MAG: methylmalonyl-CoA mutase family protein [Bacteroidota bacterium]|nr:methylmalonyl-CoA mutase family protein [Bacteroidota bacterium]